MASLSLLTFYAKDKTGTIRVSLWGENADRTKLNVNDHIMVENAERAAYQQEATVNTQTFTTVSVCYFDM
jgi:23S rRNA maturation-related 3'-5' exoribonuclease YhaM